MVDDLIEMAYDGFELLLFNFKLGFILLDGVFDDVFDDEHLGIFLYVLHHYLFVLSSQIFASQMQ